MTRRRIEALHGDAVELERRAAAVAPPLPFPAVAPAGGAVGVIAEVKRRSPSQGAIRPDLDALSHARAYVQGGAVAVSVLTDEAHFGGSMADLGAVAAAVLVPVLRKDFILDELQILEARAAGASIVLLIVRALEAGRLAALARFARSQGIATLIEVHAEAELDAALAAGPTAVGVNARDLGTFAIDTRLAGRVLARVPPQIAAVAESGVEVRADVERSAGAGADFVLVGASVARARNPEQAVRALTGVRRVGRG